MEEELLAPTNISTLEEGEQGLPIEATLMKAIAGFILTFIGVVVNVLAILTLCCDRHIRSQTTTAFVLSLATSDLLFCAVSLPHIAASNLARRLLTSIEVCAGIAFFTHALTCVSLTSMMAITVNRYVKVVHNSWYSRLYTRSSICAMLAVVWIFSFLFYTPPFTQIWGRFSRPEHDYTCKVGDDPNTGSPKIFIMLVSAIIPSTIIIVSYSRIYCTVQEARRNLKANCVKRHASEQQKRNEGHVTVMMLACFVGFVLCFTPYFALNIADPKMQRWPYLHGLSFILLAASSVINPFIYVVSNRGYRRAFLALLRRAVPCACADREKPSAQTSQDTPRILRLQDRNTQSSNTATS